MRSAPLVHPCTSQGAGRAYKRPEGSALGVDVFTAGLRNNPYKAFAESRASGLLNSVRADPDLPYAVAQRARPRNMGEQKLHLIGQDPAAL